MATVSLKNLKFKMLREEFVLMQNKNGGSIHPNGSISHT